MRAHFGIDDREAFAGRLGISKAALAYYERGERTPDASVLAAYREVFGVNISWLVTGRGDMFDDPAKAPAPHTGVDIVLLQQLHDTVQAVYIECKRTPPPRAVTADAGELYNELLGMVADIRDKAVVTALLPVLRDRFKERISKSEPGSSKVVGS
ncbi:helix-turn-helix domain-containing protein [Shinella sp. M31]|uniref:helix-turn-helix domain-containing protein n=1 Tax=Shinella sp. M31 TaxID=3368615 RepID=UPI003BA2B287